MRQNLQAQAQIIACHLALITPDAPTWTGTGVKIEILNLFMRETEGPSLPRRLQRKEMPWQHGER